MDGEPTFTAFLGHRQMAQGSLDAVAQAAARAGSDAVLLIFEDATGRSVDLDLRRGPEAAAIDYRTRTAAEDAPPRRPGRGRPKLGVVAREVTLLPRHWDWLSRQPGGASAALRRLVEDARRASAGADRAREAQEALYRVMAALAGDAPSFEEASRALFADNDDAFDAIVVTWPADVAAYLQRLAAIARRARQT